MPRFAPVALLLVLVGCGGGGVNPVFPEPDDGPQLSAGCTVIQETDEQAYLQIGGAFDQLRHDEGEGNEPIKMTTKIDNFVRQYMCDNDLPGLGLGIVWQGNLVYVKGYGLARGWESVADPSDDVPVRGQRTRFRWASVSKCVTGVAAVQASLETNGNGQPIFDLDADLASNYRCQTEFCIYTLPDEHYLGWFGNVDNINWPLDTDPLGPDEIFTPRRLLSCFSGIMHYNEGDPDDPSGKPSEADREANQGFLWAVDYFTDLPLVRAPATIWNYSSFGFNMAGAALHHATGGYMGYVQSNIADVTQPSPMVFFHPDDVYDTQYDGAPWFTTQDRTHGYDLDDDDEDVIVPNYDPNDVSYKLPSGGFISTVADMALFAEGLLNNRFLDAAGMEILLTPQEGLVKGLGITPTTGYALGFNISQQSGERMAHHNGGQQDTSTRLVIFPDGEDPTVGKLGIVVMCNARYFNREALTNQIENYLRNPYEEGGIVFEGLLPRNQDFATQDAQNRGTYGPYAAQGLYEDPQLDLYMAPRLQVRRGHQYNPNYQRAAAEPSPHQVRDDPRETSVRDETRGGPVRDPSGV